MKQLLVLGLLTILAFSLISCAGKTKEPHRVKCPACGYEFEPAKQDE